MQIRIVKRMPIDEGGARWPCRSAWRARSATLARPRARPRRGRSRAPRARCALDDAARLVDRELDADLALDAGLARAVGVRGLRHRDRLRLDQRLDARVRSGSAFALRGVSAFGARLARARAARRSAELPSGTAMPPPPADAARQRQAEVGDRRGGRCGAAAAAARRCGRGLRRGRLRRPCAPACGACDLRRRGRWRRLLRRLRRLGFFTSRIVIARRLRAPRLVDAHDAPWPRPRAATKLAP